MECSLIRIFYRHFGTSRGRLCIYALKSEFFILNGRENPGLYFYFKYKKFLYPIYLITVYLAVCCGCILATIACSFFSFATRSLFDSCKVSMVLLKSLFSFTRISTFLSNWSMYSFFFLRLSCADI